MVPSEQERSVKIDAKPSSRLEWTITGTGWAAVSAIAFSDSAVVKTSSSQCGWRKAKYWPRLPIDVEPESKAAMVFSKAAGVPMTKSPKWGATGAALVNDIQSSTS